ncbi:MAG TPA: ATP phosphoribosyltransferase regulatory subunit, partial [Solirubrobacteraceae bacterium]|nr:ATP phosphoribosyltransferase regulatory subunit [Solirubrobacteraceae bacterium]
AFDADDPGTRAVMAGAPRLLDQLAPEDAEHFAEVRRLLDAAGVGYEIDSALVRGLDYYTRTLFEFTSDALGAQSGVAGGGRYDALVEQLGGPPTPAVGWAAGIERILLAGGEAPAGSTPLELFVALDDGARTEDAFATLVAARRAGLRTDMEFAGRSLKGQFKQADRLGARYVAILHPGGAELRDMSSSEQEAIASDPGQEGVSPNSIVTAALRVLRGVA